MKQYNPDLYKRYDEELNSYNMRKNKVQSSGDSMFDPSIGKSTIDSITEVLDTATNQSGSLSNLTDEQISDIYDGVQLLKDMSSGKRQDISYSTLSELTQSLFNELPPELQTKLQPEIQRINQNIKTNLRQKFDGDSDLFEEIKFNRPTKIPDTSRDPNNQDPNKPNKQDPNKPDLNNQDTNDQDTNDPTKRAGGVNERTMPSDIVGDLRPRLQWGGDKVLIATKEETNLMNAIADSMSLDDVGWGNGRDNTLFNINNIDTEKRYSNCFAMPPPPKPNPKPPSGEFIKSQSIIWSSQLPPVNNYKYMRDNLDFGQYQHLSERVNISSTNPAMEIMNNPNQFPAQIDKQTGGERMKIFGSNDYILNQRFTSRR
jgi:hypothetical protein